MTRLCETDSAESLLSFFKKNLTRNAPTELKNAVAAGDEAEIWSVWKVLLRKRAAFFRLENHFRRLFWGLDLTDNGFRTLTELTRREKGIPYFLSEKSSPCQAATVQFASLDAMTESILIDFYAASVETAFSMSSLSPSEWLALMEETERFLVEDASSAFPEDSPAGQLLLGEIPLFLRTVYPELKIAVTAGKSAARRLTDGLKTTLDSVGLPDLDRFSAFRSLLAVWTRAQIIAKWAGETLFTGSTAKRFEWCLLQNVRLLRSDGTLAFTQSDSPPETRRENLRLFLEMIQEAIPFDHDPRDIAAAALSLDRLIPDKERDSFPAISSRRKQGVSFSQNDAPEAASFSDDSTIAAIRSEWGIDKTALFTAVSPSGKVPRLGKKGIGQNPKTFSFQIDLNHLETNFLRGIWNAAIRKNGKSLEAVGDWALNCEESDESKIYSEMTCPLSDNMRLERSILYVPEDQILILADALVDGSTEEDSPETETASPEAKQASLQTDSVFYEGRLSLAEGIDAVPDSSGCEILLRNGGKNRSKTKAALRLFPLALNEWRENLTEDDFGVCGHEVIFRLFRKGGALFAPILFDLDPSRIKKRYTWRKLTVGENRKRVDEDRAVGYRVHLGNRQFLLYRSLKDRGCRSVLGAHFDQEFVFARFDPDKGVETILEICPVEE